MLLAKLFLSGFLVAGGLILGAFTLHGYLDPQWQQRQMQAASPRELSKEPKSINAFQSRSQFVSTPTAPHDPATQPQLVKASVMPNAKPSDVAAADAKAAAARAAARRKLAEKKRADKERAEKADKLAKAKQQPQQATVQWPWNWLGN